MNTIENCLLLYTHNNLTAYWPFMKCAGELGQTPPIATTTTPSRLTSLSLSLSLSLHLSWLR